MYEAYEAEAETGGTGRQVGRLIATLTGAAAVVVFVMFAIESYRYHGHDFTTAMGDVHTGAWLQLVGVGVAVGRESHR